MKKLYHLLMFLMLSILLVACTASKEDVKEDKKTESTKETKKGKKNKSKDKSKDESDEDESDEEESKYVEETKEGKKTPSKSTRPITLKNEMLVDNELFSITAKSIDEDSEYGYTVYLLIENKSPDKTYTFNIQKGEVNGVEVNLYTVIFVNPQKKGKYIGYY